MTKTIGSRDLKINFVARALNTAQAEIKVGGEFALMGNGNLVRQSMAITS